MKKNRNNRTVLIIIAVIVGVALAASIATLVVVLIAKNTFVKNDGVAISEYSLAALGCRLEASKDATSFFDRTNTLIVPYPTTQGWNLDEKIVKNDIYTSDGYPTYTYSWYGDYEGTPVKYECLIKTSKESASIIWLKLLSTKIVDNTVDLYNSDGKLLESD